MTRTEDHGQALSPITHHPSLSLSHPADQIISTQPLGAIYAPEKTIFRVWAPTASSLTLRLYKSPTGGRARQKTMTPQSDGTWEVMVPGDQRGVYYTYCASGIDPRFNPARELIDPYARAVTAYNGRAVVVHDTTPVADRPIFPIEHAIIY